MGLMAPNLLAIVGSSTAAKLLAIAGGLTALSKIPACNLQVVGKSGRLNSALSVVGQQKHAGIIFFSDLVMVLPQEYRSKATKIVAAK